MANWKYSIELNKVLREQTEKYGYSSVSPLREVNQETKNEVVKEIRKAPPLVEFSLSIYICRTVADFNAVLDIVFDEADKEKVWCGF